MPAKSPIDPILERQGVVILDGGLATELEARGCDLNDELWSARILMESPDLIRQVHLDYLAAGADCIVSASYQATIPGFMKKGVSEDEAVELLRRSVTLAKEARDRFWNHPENQAGRLRPLVAASIGPYGSYLADGSEYRGHYGIDHVELADFHRERWHILAQSGADLLACETLPSRDEALALRELLRETTDVQAWFSFSCRDELHLSDENLFSEMIEELAEEPRVVAVGINCTAPRFISPLIEEACLRTKKPIIVYPNSGESFNPGSKQWVKSAAPVDLSEAAREWLGKGASLIGGCCRTRPEQIRQIRDTLLAGTED